MRSFLLLFLFGYFFTTNEAKVFNRCELARTLKRMGLDGYYVYSLANWVCMAKHESKYNTRAKNSKNDDGTTDYGIFQVNNKWWCSDRRYPSRHGCNIPCSRLLDDNIFDDVECAKRVVRDPKRMYAWRAWRDNCRGRNLFEYVSGCGL